MRILKINKMEKKQDKINKGKEKFQKLQSKTRLAEDTPMLLEAMLQHML